MMTWTGPEPSQNEQISDGARHRQERRRLSLLTFFAPRLDDSFRADLSWPPSPRLSSKIHGLAARFEDPASADGLRYDVSA